MFNIYKDAAGEWRWRFVAKNHKTTADSGEGYRRRYEAVKSVERHKKAVAEAQIVEVLRDG